MVHHGHAGGVLTPCQRLGHVQHPLGHLHTAVLVKASGRQHVGEGVEADEGRLQVVGVVEQRPVVFGFEAEEGKVVHVRVHRGAVGPHVAQQARDCLDAGLLIHEEDIPAVLDDLEHPRQGNDRLPALGLAVEHVDAACHDKVLDDPLGRLRPLVDDGADELPPGEPVDVL